MCTADSVACLASCSSNRDCASICSFCAPKIKSCQPGKPCGYSCAFNEDCDQMGSCPYCAGGSCSMSPASTRSKKVTVVEDVEP